MPFSGTAAAWYQAGPRSFERGSGTRSQNHGGFSHPLAGSLGWGFTDVDGLPPGEGPTDGDQTRTDRPAGDGAVDPVVPRPGEPAPRRRALRSARGRDPGEDRLSVQEPVRAAVPGAGDEP